MFIFLFEVCADTSLYILTWLVSTFFLAHQVDTPLLIRNMFISINEQVKQPFCRRRMRSFLSNPKWNISSFALINWNMCVPSCCTREQKWSGSTIVSTVVTMNISYLLFCWGSLSVRRKTRQHCHHAKRNAPPSLVCSAQQDKSNPRWNVELDWFGPTAYLSKHGQHNKQSVRARVNRDPIRDGVQHREKFGESLRREKTAGGDAYYAAFEVWSRWSHCLVVF